MASRKEQKAAARERLRKEMEQRKRRARRNRVIAITAGALVVVVAVVAVGIFVQKQRQQEAEAKANQRQGTPTRVAKDGLGIVVGKSSAPVTLKVYEDFRCPACQQFEQTYGSTISKLVDEGKLKVEYHIATIIDANSPGTSGSKIAGNAAVCANEVGKFRDYHKVLYDNQPPEQQDAFTTKQVLKLADQVDGLSDNEKFTKCVEGNRYRDWLTQKVQGEMDKRFNPPSTPSLVLDDKVMLGGNKRSIGSEMASPQKFEQTVDQRAK